MKFLTKKFSTIILTISSLILIYIFYKSEIILQGTNREYYKIYFLISLILVFFSIISYSINYKIKEYLIILIISILFSLYLFEGFLIFNKQPKKSQLIKNQLLREKEYLKQTGRKWERRSKYEIYNNLKKIDNEIKMTVTPHNYLYKEYSIYPLSGISNSKTIFCNENGYYSIYESDRYGFNNPDTEWDKKEIEYLLLGDSFVHGACVNRPNDISSVLRILSNKSVLNLGQASNGPLTEYATFREYFSKNVKKVIWIFYYNDFGNIVHEKRNNILTNYLNNVNFTQNLKTKQHEINYLAENLIRERKEEIDEKLEKEKANSLKLKKFFKLSNIRILLMPPSALAIAPDFKKVIQSTKDLVEKNNSKFYFVYLSEYNRSKKNFNYTNFNLVKEIIRKLDIEFIDIHQEVIKKDQNPLKLFSYHDGHYNVEGYKKVAEIIYELTKN